MSPLRFLTPGQLLICLVLFFLPWIEIQCPVPGFGNLNFEDPQKKATVKVAGYTPFLSQSGFQAATGDYTIKDPTVRQMMEQSKKMAKELEKMGGKAGKAEKEDEVKAAPLLFLFPLAAIAGIALGIAMPGGAVKKGILIGCCALVLVSAGGQAAMGFPVEKDIKEKQKKQDAAGAGGAKGPAVEGDVLKGAGGAKAAGFEGDEVKTVYKFPFYLALLFAVGGIVTAAIEPAGTGKGKKKPKRRRYDEDEDDEEPLPLDDDDEEPEERPKPKYRSRERDDDRDDRRSRRDRDDRGGKRGKNTREEADPDNPFAGLG